MKILLAAMLLSGMLAGCTSNRQTTNNNMEQELDLTQEVGQGVPAEREGESPKGDVYDTVWTDAGGRPLYTSLPRPLQREGRKVTCHCGLWSLQ